MPYRGSKISVLVAKNLKLTMFMFKIVKQCSKFYDIFCANSNSMLQYQHQWDLEQKKTDNLNMPKVDKSNWAKTSPSPQSQMMGEGCSTGLCDQTVHQGGTYLT